MNKDYIAPTYVRSHPVNPQGVQLVYRFANGRGASVVKAQHSYGFKDGLWELCETTHKIEDLDHLNFEVTTEVAGWLSDKDLQDKLKEIKAK